MWIWYNKLDTKLSELRKGGKFMKRRVYDKQFKIVAVKYVINENHSTHEENKKFGVKNNLEQIC